MVGEAGAGGAADEVGVPIARLLRGRLQTRDRLPVVGAVVLGMLCCAAPGRAQQVVPRAAHARLSGVVFDSVASEPLASATVQLVPTRDASRARSIQSGSDGRFVFDSVEAGEYILGFYHARLDSLGLEPPMGKVMLAAGDSADVPLAVVSSATVVRSTCGAATLADSLGLMVGRVRSAIDGSPRAHAHVMATWSEVTLGAEGLKRSAPVVRTQADDHGAFALCGIPAGARMIVRAWSDRDSSGFAELDVPPHGLLARSVLVAPLASADGGLAAGDSALAGLSGAGILRGVVRRPDGEPLPNARLTVWGSGRDATSAADGTYSLAGLPVGTHTLEARAIGYAPLREAVDLIGGEGVTRDVQLAKAPLLLDTVRVRGEGGARRWGLQEFEARRRTGTGYYLDEAAITARNAFFTADLVRTIPGVTVAPGRRSGYLVLMRGGSNMQNCVPAFYVDGVQVYSEDGNLDDIVSVPLIQAMEVYTRISSIPLQFQAMNGCGTVVIWTGGRKPAETSR